MFQKGQSLIELLVAIGLIGILMPALLTGLVAASSGKAQEKQSLIAVGLLKQTQEEVRIIRESGWVNFATSNGTLFHPIPSGNSFALAPGPVTVGDFTRQLVISDVQRDATGKIVALGGTVDPSTKRVDITVSWSLPHSSSIQSTLYLTRYLENSFFTQTTQTHFNTAGSVKNAVDVRATTGSPLPDDGEILLSENGAADWCNPGAPSARLDLTGNGETRSVVAGVDRAFVSSGGNNAGRDFWNVTITSAFPPVPTEAGTYDQNGVKANQVFGESHFAYLATDKNSNEVVILDVSSGTPTLLLNLDLPNNTNGKSIFVSNNYLFVATADNMLYRYLLAADRKSATPKGSLNLSATGNAMYVSNNYVFIAMNSSSTQLQIVDANDPNTLQATGSLSVGNNEVGQSLFVSSTGDRTYLVTRRSASQSEFFIINTQSKSSPANIGSGYDTGAMDPQGITVIDNRAIIVGLNRPQYQVIKVDNDNYNPCASVPKAGDPDIDDIYNVSSIYANGHAYSYIVTANSSFEFQIIEGGAGAGGGTYVSTGTFESSPILAGSFPVAFNRYDVTFTKPAGTDIQFYVGAADADVLTGSCTGVSFTYDGPYTDDGPIPLDNDGAAYENPAQCFRYKIVLTADPSGNATPIFKDITVNYSP